MVGAYDSGEREEEDMTIRERLRTNLREFISGFLDVHPLKDHERRYALHMLFSDELPTGDLAKIATDCVDHLKGRLVVLHDLRAFDELNELRGLVLGLTSNMPRPSIDRVIPFAIDAGPMSVP